MMELRWKWSKAFRFTKLYAWFDDSGVRLTPWCSKKVDRPKEIKRTRGTKLALNLGESYHDYE